MKLLRLRLRLLQAMRRQQKLLLLRLRQLLLLKMHH